MKQIQWKPTEGQIAVLEWLLGYTAETNWHYEDTKDLVRYIKSLAPAPPTITFWGLTNDRELVLNCLKEMGHPVLQPDSDFSIIQEINNLSDEEANTLLEQLKQL